MNRSNFFKLRAYVGPSIVCTMGVCVANFSLCRVQLKKYIHPSTIPLGTEKFCFGAPISWKLLRSSNRDWNFGKHPVYTYTRSADSRVAVSVYTCLCIQLRVYMCICAVYMRSCTERSVERCGSRARSPRMMRNERNHKCPLSGVTRLREPERVMTSREDIYR